MRVANSLIATLSVRCLALSSQAEVVITRRVVSEWSFALEELEDVYLRLAATLILVQHFDPISLMLSIQSNKFLIVNKM